MAVTPTTGIKIPAHIKAAAKTRAMTEGRSLTDVALILLDLYGKGKIDARPPNLRNRNSGTVHAQRINSGTQNSGKQTVCFATNAAYEFYETDMAATCKNCLREESKNG